MDYNLENRSCHTQYISEKKWESRLIGERYVPSSDSNQELVVGACGVNVSAILVFQDFRTVR